MTLHFWQYAVVCPLVFLAGFVDAIAGGGGLISLPAYMLIGLPAHNAVATNKFSACVGTAVATGRYARNGYIPLRLALVCIPAALVGSSCGAELALRVPDGVFKILMLFILPVVAIYSLRKKDLSGGSPLKELPWRKTAWQGILISLFMGVYDGFYGPGMGVFLMLLLTGVSHLDLNTAAGTTKIINLSTNFAALTVFLFNGKVIYPLGLTAMLFGMAGNWLGAKEFSKKGTRIVRPVILLVLAMFFVKILWELFSEA